MSKEDNGGPAFPPVHDPKNHPSGMTLRDYLAAHSQAICPFNVYEHEQSAEWCYARADALLEARKK